MGYTATNGQNNNVNAVAFYWLDTDADLGDLPEDAPNGSIACSIATGTKYVKDSLGEWQVLV